MVNYSVDLSLTGPEKNKTRENNKNKKLELKWDKQDEWGGQRIRSQRRWSLYHRILEMYVSEVLGNDEVVKKSCLGTKQTESACHALLGTLC